MSDFGFEDWCGGFHEVLRTGNGSWDGVAVVMLVEGEKEVRQTFVRVERKDRGD